MTESAEQIQGGSPAPVAGVGASITAVLLSIVLWVTLVLTPWSAIRARKKEEPSNAADQTKNFDPKRAEFVYEAGMAAQEHTDDKAKHLLALASSLAAFLIVFSSSLDPIWPGFVAVGALLICVSLCVFLLGVRRQMSPTPEPMDADPHGYEWARDLIKSAVYNEQHQRFSVDLYAASRRWLFVGLGFLFLILLLPHRSDPDPVAASVDRASTSLQVEIQMLRRELKSLLEELETMSDQSGQSPEPSGLVEPG